MRVYVVGAGLAGLAASVRLAEHGQAVTLIDAAPQAGGRCRSYHDKTLGRVIDNGNHLMLSGNTSLFDYLDTIGARDSLIGPEAARYPFLDLRTGERWEVAIGDGLLSPWLSDPTVSVPGADMVSRLKGLRLAVASRESTIATCLGGTGKLWERFWDPMATAVLNTPPEIASASLLKAAMVESFAKGGSACRPLIAKESLAASLIDPAIAFLEERGARRVLGRRLRSMTLGDRAEQLQFADEQSALNPGDHVILALPPAQAADLIPGLDVPEGSHAIVNAHFLLPEPASLPNRSSLLGLVGGHAQWLFVRDEIASVTVSAADALAEKSADDVAELLWKEVAIAIGRRGESLPSHRIVKEKRATFSQTPAAIKKRPQSGTRWSNLHLAGDWTDTGLPATIEGAIRSGQKAADRVLRTASLGGTR